MKMNNSSETVIKWKQEAVFTAATVPTIEIENTTLSKSDNNQEA